ncbi:MAG: sulfonate transport system permease protein [Frankiales bacterium]|nr:sulfonate transport system permease protein [Frankiales bacterium]
MSEPSLRVRPMSPAGLPVAAREPEGAVLARKYRQRKRLVWILRIVLAVAIVGGWEVSARNKLIDPFFYGQPSLIWHQLVRWVNHGTSNGSLWRQIFVTMEETVIGFLIGVALGVLFGVVLGVNRLLADIFSPYIKAFNSIPRVVLGAIFTIAFGLGLTSKVMLAVVLVFFVVFFNAFQGVREVDPNLIANARILGAGRARVTREVIIPSALSWILASLHTSFGFALVGAVVGEFLGSTEGLGSLIVIAQNTFNVSGVFAAMVILAVVALIAESLVTALENRLIRWRPTPVTDITI